MEMILSVVLLLLIVAFWAAVIRLELQRRRWQAICEIGTAMNRTLWHSMDPADRARARVAYPHFTDELDVN